MLQENKANVNKTLAIDKLEMFIGGSNRNSVNAMQPTKAFELPNAKFLTPSARRMCEINAPYYLRIHTKKAGII